MGEISDPRFGEFCSCCCLPLLPELACSIHETWPKHFSGALCHCNRQALQCYRRRRRHCARGHTKSETRQSIPLKGKIRPFRSRIPIGRASPARSEPGCASFESKLPTELSFPSGLTRPYLAAIVWAQCHCIRYRRRQNWADQSLRHTSRFWISFNVDWERPQKSEIRRDINEGATRGATHRSTKMNHL